MQEHYNAFISYRHAELDSKIAEHVQRSLEHFGIPGKIKKKYNINKIERVFRDKDELPITANLNDTIQNALINADYLIVICSPSTRESIWVQREIEFFLSTHSRDKVLTVLADGEPFEVIPEILLKEERTVTDDNGNEVKITVDLEPLSCDYRMGTRKADKEELPRLASCLVGCSYDELMNRRRQYRAKRAAIIVAAVFVALIAFGSYIFYSMTQVQKSLHQAQISNSQYLAGESRRLLDNQERNKAIQLALLALPSEEQDIPLIPEAQRVLTDAVYAYVTQSNNNLGTVWNYSMPTDVKMIRVSNDGRTLIAVDEADNINVWNTESKGAALSLPRCPYKILNIDFSPDNDIFTISTEKLLYAYSLSRGAKIWEIESPVCYSGTPHFSNDGKYIYIADLYDGCKKIDAASGVSIDYINDYNDGFISVNEMYVSPDNDKFITFGMESTSAYDHFKVILYNMSTDAMDILEEVDADLYSADWIDNSRVIIQTKSDGGSIDFQDGDFHYATTTLTTTCIDISAKQILWSNQITYSDNNSENHGIPAPNGSTYIAYAGTRYEEYDIETGELVTQFDASASILKVEVSPNTGTPYYYTSDGIRGMSLGEYGEHLEHRLTDNNVADITGNGSIYIAEANTNSIIQLSYNLYDDNWRSTNGLFPSYEITPDQVYIAEESIVLIDNYNNNLYFVDADRNRLSSPIDLNKIINDGLYSNDCRILGVYDGLLYIESQLWGELSIIEVDLSTKNASRRFYYSDVFIECHSLLVDKYLMIGTGYGQDAEFVVINLETNKETKFAIENYSENREIVTNILPNANIAHYIDGFGQDHFVNIDNKKEVRFDFPDNWGETVAMADSSKGNIYIADSMRIAVFDFSGNFITEIVNNLGQVEQLYINSSDEANNETLFAIINTGFLCRYDSDYNFLGSTRITLNQSTNALSIVIDPKTSCMYIKDGDTLDIIETDNWYEVASINNAIGHHSPSDKIYTYAMIEAGGLSIGYFEHYSIEQLEQMGRDIIGDYTMSDEERAEYGL